MTAPAGYKGHLSIWSRNVRHIDKIDRLIEGLAILIVDENPYMRRLTRMMLLNIGVKLVYEAGDGAAALDVIRNTNPDVAIIDWDLPVLSGPPNSSGSARLTFQNPSLLCTAINAPAMSLNIWRYSS